MIKILLADDDDGLRRVIQYKLQQNKYDVTAVENGQKALDAIKSQKFDLVLSDMKMPKLSGIELLEKIKEIQPELEVILITAHADISQAVLAVKIGAFDYLPKPFEDDQLFQTIEKALKVRRLEKENKKLKQKLQKQNKPFHIVGVSKSFKKLQELIKQVAPSDATILLTGASGTGKEVLAKLIHQQSSRASHEMITINCAAIPRDLLESELFGHTKGSFTGAIQDKKGKFELAHNSTLFLDEISELPLDLQAKLLRAVQERIIEPIGAEKSKEVDIRLITATNQNLKEKVNKGLFREDLFYRLNVIPIEIPKLSNRKEDILILANGFLKKFSPEDIKLTSELQEAFLKHSWPGNIRELENLIERMVILRKKDILSMKDLPDDFDMTSHQDSKQEDINSSNQMTFYEAEINLIKNALIKTANNKSKAAKLLKIPRHILIYRMKKYDLFQADLEI